MLSLSPVNKKQVTHTQESPAEPVGEAECHMSAMHNYCKMLPLHEKKYTLLAMNVELQGTILSPLRLSLLLKFADYAMETKRNFRSEVRKATKPSTVKFILTLQYFFFCIDNKKNFS